MRKIKETKIKGRLVVLIAYDGNQYNAISPSPFLPDTWVIADKPLPKALSAENVPPDETMTVKHFNEKLEAMVYYQRIINSYKRSRKDHYNKPIRPRNRHGKLSTSV